MLNLSHEQYLKLRKQWISDAHRDLELLYGWCGRPSLAGERVAFGLVFGEDKDGQMEFYLSLKNISEDELDRYIEELNAALRKIGAPEVEKNIPEDVDWSQFGNDPLVSEGP